MSFSLVFEVDMSKYNAILDLLDSFQYISIAGSDKEGILAMLGDVNEDGKIKRDDATLIAKFMHGSFNPTNRQKVAMDVDMDGDIDLYDVIATDNM